MRHGFAPAPPQGTVPAGLFFIAPSTAMAGATVIEAPDWSVFDVHAPDGVSEWTEEEIVYLHWRLLQDVQMLADPDAPLDEKLATLRWVFTEPEKDRQPFSFASCLQVVGSSPLSPIPYCGAIDCEDVRHHIARETRRWMQESLSRYPQWIKDALANNPDWVDAQLSRNPQWLNEQVNRHSAQGDLFA
ncbi:hypothetical protein [Pseudorhodoferax soli]|uniref:Uncharacterized protein n=1 Tax=Pseudorhodoferax soli TaxID=545864 RepID=A0A368XNW2_9BURK|nr:hypothetical protein [Pseudorhodoferax soli]RCW69545.1 hypothetical protein DES41_106419 [Pseudorhodoferax soli]